MQITLDIPDDLVPVVVRIIQTRHCDNNDGMTDVSIMNDLHLSVEQFVQANNLVDNIARKISQINTPPSPPFPVLQPYEHDCDHCIWCGWLRCENARNGWGNLYFCRRVNHVGNDLGTIIIRFGDDVPEYLSIPVGAVTKGSIVINNRKAVKW